MVYIFSFERLIQYAEEIESRNRAFTSISRSKGFVRISGSGKWMRSVVDELNVILSDVPYFRFEFPDMDTIRRLDASETSRRRREVRNAKESIDKLIGIDRGALTDLDPDQLRKLRELLDGITHEDN
jgi:superfamily I DNA and RNA helicase